jgi:hypothetical protein
MAIPTQGTQISITIGAAPGTKTLIAEATGWSGPRFTRNEIDITNLQSVAKEYLLGLKDPGEFSVDVNFDLSDAGQSAAWDELGGNSPLPVELKFLDTSKGGFTFNALVMNFETQGRADDKATGTITFRITGDVMKIEPVAAA